MKIARRSSELSNPHDRNFSSDWFPPAEGQAAPMAVRGAEGARRAPRATRPQVRVVEGDVPHGRGLFLDARLPARHRVHRGRRALADRDIHPDSPHAVRRVADLQPGGREQPARAGQHLDARGAPASMARQGVRAVPARIRRDGLRHHDYVVRGGRDGAHHREPVRSEVPESSGRADARAAGAPVGGVPQGVQRGDQPRGRNRRRVPRAERGGDRLGDSRDTSAPRILPPVAERAGRRSTSARG